MTRRARLAFSFFTNGSRFICGPRLIDQRASLRIHTFNDTAILNFYIYIRTCGDQFPAMVGMHRHPGPHLAYRHPLEPSALFNNQGANEHQSATAAHPFNTFRSVFLHAFKKNNGVMNTGEKSEPPVGMNRSGFHREICCITNIIIYFQWFGNGKFIACRHFFRYPVSILSFFYGFPPPLTPVYGDAGVRIPCKPCTPLAGTTAPYFLFRG